MHLGDFSHKITFQNRVDDDTENDEHETVKTLKDYITVWASIEPVKGREYYEAQAATSELTYNIYVRYSSDITINPSMLIKFGDRIFRIIDISNIAERNRYWLIRAVEKVAV